MVAVATGPRPMKPDEWEAYTLHLQRVPVDAIEEQTKLSRPWIAAAVDLGQLHAQAALQATVADPEPAAQRQPVRIRRTVLPQLPGAAIPPTPTLPELNDPPPARTAPAADPIRENTAAPVPPAAPEPDLDRLARSAEVRTWAAADGWVVPAPGLRLPGGIVHAYLKAHGGTQ